MNAMPMAYALKFVRDGYDVRYVVDAPAGDTLMRPEFHFPSEVAHPYPDWILELPWSNTLLNHATAPWSHRAGLQAMSDRDIVFLNDASLALGAWLPRTAMCVALSSGSDVDLYTRWPLAFSLASRTRRRWLYPVRLALELMRTALQRNGLDRCEVICYFPRGLNPVGDAVVARQIRRGKARHVVERYDVNFAATGVWREPLHDRPLSEIVVPVRFNMRPPPGNEFEYKGNDRILRALAAFSRRQPALRVHLFEKGDPEDLRLARQMVRELGLEPHVIWHKTMPLRDLLQLFAASDLVFDQVGSHWMGAIGCYALYMGRPVIANARLEVFGRLWGDEIPILDACTEETILQHLIRCEDLEFRRRIAEQGHGFAVRHLDTESAYRRLAAATVRQWHARLGVEPVRDAP